MKTVTIHPWNNNHFTHNNKVLVKVKAEVFSDDGLAEEHHVNLVVTDNVNETFINIENLTSQVVENYKLSLEEE